MRQILNCPVNQGKGVPNQIFWIRLADLRNLFLHLCSICLWRARCLSCAIDPDHVPRERKNDCGHRIRPARACVAVEDNYVGLMFVASTPRSGRRMAEAPERVWEWKRSGWLDMELLGEGYSSCSVIDRRSEDGVLCHMRACPMMSVEKVKCVSTPWALWSWISGLLWWPWP